MVQKAHTIETWKATEGIKILACLLDIKEVHILINGSRSDSWSESRTHPCRICCSSENMSFDQWIENRKIEILGIRILDIFAFGS